MTTLQLGGLPGGGHALYIDGVPQRDDEIADMYVGTLVAFVLANVDAAVAQAYRAGAIAGVQAGADAGVELAIAHVRASLVAPVVTRR